MSHFVKVVTAIKDQKALVLALGRLGFEGKVEIYSEAQSLIGYKGDKREQKAHVILRRKHVGSASNDIGFERINGVYIAHISEYDHGSYGEAWQKKLFTYYGVEKAKLTFKSQGYAYEEDQDSEGRIRVRALNL